MLGPSMKPHTKAASESDLINHAKADAKSDNQTCKKRSDAIHSAAEREENKLLKPHTKAAL